MLLAHAAPGFQCVCCSKNTTLLIRPGWEYPSNSVCPAETMLAEGDAMRKSPSLPPIVTGLKPNQQATGFIDHRRNHTPKSRGIYLHHTPHEHQSAVAHQHGRLLQSFHYILLHYRNKQGVHFSVVKVPSRSAALSEDNLYFTSANFQVHYSPSVPVAANGDVTPPCQSQSLPSEASPGPEAAARPM